MSGYAPFERSDGIRRRRSSGLNANPGPWARGARTLAATVLACVAVACSGNTHGTKPAPTVAEGVRFPVVRDGPATLFASWTEHWVCAAVEFDGVGVRESTQHCRDPLGPGQAIRFLGVGEHGPQGAIVPTRWLVYGLVAENAASVRVHLANGDTSVTTSIADALALPFAARLFLATVPADSDAISIEAVRANGSSLGSERVSSFFDALNDIRVFTSQEPALGPPLDLGHGVHGRTRWQAVAFASAEHGQCLELRESESVHPHCGLAEPPTLADAHAAPFDLLVGEEADAPSWFLLGPVPRGTVAIAVNSDAGETLRLEPMGGPGLPARFFFGVLQQPASSASLTALGKGGVVLERRALALG